MKIGIIGLGAVGDALKTSFEKYQHTVLGYDINSVDSCQFNELIETDCAFVCVPTPTVNGKADTSIVAQVVADLDKINYKGRCVIKSTVLPGTTESLIIQHKNLDISFIPEFLRQDHAHDDFLDQTVLIVGTHCSETFEFFSQLHSPFCRKSQKLTPTEAEITKYFVNNFNALRITFANIFFEVCQRLDADYQQVLSAAITRPVINGDSYLRCDENLRGFKGKCLPKDAEAMFDFLKTIDLPVELIGAMINDNSKFTRF